MIGLYGIYQALSVGAVTFGITDQFPWGLLVSTYEFFLLMGAGIVISVVSLALIFHVRGAEIVLKRSIFVGIAAVTAGLFSITISLGRPERPFVHAFLNANLSSPIWWVVLFAGSLIAVLVLLAVLMELDNFVDAPVMEAVGVISFIVALGVILGAGYIFGMVESRPYWGGIFAPLYFLLTAITSGLALVAFVVIAEFKIRDESMCIELEEFMTRPVAVGLGALVGLTLLFAFLKGIYGLTATSDTVAMAYQQMLLGSFAPIYWGVGIFVGLVVPLGLLAYPKTRTINGVFASAAAVIVGVFVTRYEFVVGGQVVALVADPGYEYPIASYSPSLVEGALVVFAVALCGLVYTIGMRWFALDIIPEFAQTDMSSCTGGPMKGDDDD
ncbi:polysulfide reductase NrfD [Halalkaliarchaeum desulfuricum]|uniref:Polysulfide reductase NrfD n=1 Tax=Halalkaliarchaeum desulfuricum TaxID=2055893 RepID=A0A343TMH9_9EURY|nr:polysulfide reductase NrfD [Halalkaliarchaeum desulfuricum]